MTSPKRPIAIDLFAGAGGMTLGFEQAGFDVLAAVELDPIHCATHEFNFPFWSVICADVRHLTGVTIRSLSGIGKREVDVVFGGPPCQGFSLIGKRAMDDPRNSLVFHFMRLVLEIRPKYFVMENVAGLTVGNHKKFVCELIDAFSANGYLVKENYEVLNAAHYGVPQNRRRLFLYGCLPEYKLPDYPISRTRPANLNGNTPSSLTNLEFGPTVGAALDDLPDADRFSELLERDWVRVDLREPSDYSAVLRGATTASSDFSYPRQFDRQLLTASLRTVHTPLSVERFRQALPGTTEPISRFLKLDRSGICNTLRAGTPSNRGAFTSPRPIHPIYPRCITVREAARLHSYPDWFRFHTTKWHGFRQIGNSVPPLLARSVAAEIIRALGVEPFKPQALKSLGDESLLQLNMSEAAVKYSVDPHVIEPRTRGKERDVNGQITFI